MNIDYFNDFFDGDEKPLDRIPADGGYTSIFRRIGFIGDSLSSGEFEALSTNGGKTYHDMFEYSWGQFIARKCGLEAINLSRGGMTCREYLDTFADANRYWDPQLAAQAYVIALGYNDFFGFNEEPGNCSDICIENYDLNKNTFTGMYAKIIQKYKCIQPRARFFLMTLCNEPYQTEKNKEYAVIHRKILYDIASFFENTYVIDLYKYGPVHDEEFRDLFYMGGHLNPMGYKLTADITAAYIDFIIRHNPHDFRDVGFIGTDLWETF